MTALPSANQLQNLSRMTEILSKNWKSRILAHSLWQFFNYQLYCAVRDEADRSNRCRIDGILNPSKVDEIRIFISIRQDRRAEEALVHELLHANLIPLGYPRFWIDEEEASGKWVLAAGVINLADHVVIRPIYSSLGYSVDEFLSPSRPLNEREKRVDAELQLVKDVLATPAGYSAQLAAYLKHHDIKFHVLDLVSSIVRNKLELHEFVTFSS